MMSEAGKKRKEQLRRAEELACAVDGLVFDPGQFEKDVRRIDFEEDLDTAPEVVAYQRAKERHAKTGGDFVSIFQEELEVARRL